MPDVYARRCRSCKAKAFNRFLGKIARIMNFLRLFILQKLKFYSALVVPVGQAALGGASRKFVRMFALAAREWLKAAGFNYFSSCSVLHRC